MCHNVKCVPPDNWDILHRKAVQGFVHGAVSLFLVQGDEDEQWSCLRLARAAAWMGHRFVVPQYACLPTLLRTALMAFAGPEMDACIFIRLYILHQSDQISSEVVHSMSFYEDFLQSKLNPAVLHFSVACPQAWRVLVTEAAAHLEG